MLEYILESKILTDAILLARRDLIHPKILTAKELFNNLKKFMLNYGKLIK